MLDGCTLANTGMGQMPLLITALALIAIAVGILLARKRYGRSGAFLIFFAVLAASFMLTTPSASAQSACDPGSTGSTTPPATSLQLVNDTYEGTLGENLELTIISNDLFPSGDLIDWATLDLDPSTPEVDTGAILYNSLGYDCGTVFYDFEALPEKVIANASSGGCTDPETSDSYPPSGSVSFRYTARSQSGILAPSPATVTITYEGTTALDHNIEINFNSGDSASDNVANDAVAIDDTINATSVDLDPSTPGQQTSIVVQSTADPDIDVTIEVDNDGLVTATASSTGNTSCSSGGLTDPIPYTIRSTGGVLSNQALIYINFINNCG